MCKNRPLLLLFRVVLGGLFIYAGVVKVADPLGFAQDIRNYRLVGQSLSFAAAVVLPWLEILAGAFLIAGVWKRGAALVITGLLVFFNLLTLVTMARGLRRRLRLLRLPQPQVRLGRRPRGPGDAGAGPLCVVR